LPAVHDSNPALGICATAGEAAIRNAPRIQCSGKRGLMWVLQNVI
jgi:hypothetical protein